MDSAEGGHPGLVPVSAGSRPSGKRVKIWGQVLQSNTHCGKKKWSDLLSRKIGDRPRISRVAREMGMMADGRSYHIHPEFLERYGIIFLEGPLVGKDTG